MLDLLGPLAEGKSQPLRDWLAGHGVDTEALWRLPRWNTGGSDGVPTLRRGPHGSVSRVADVLATQLPIAARVPGGAALLLLYLRHEVEEAWEISYHYRPMWDTLRGAPAYLADHPELVSGDDRVAVDAVLALMANLDQEILVENAMTCGRLAAFARAADAAAAASQQAAGLALRLAGPMPALSAHIRTLATANQAYDHAVAVAARAVGDFFAKPGVLLDEAIANLAAAEAGEDLAEHRDVSELRAHRFSLSALRDAQTQDWLWIDHGKIVYIYPFALRGAQAEDMAGRAGSHGTEWTLGGVKPTGAHDSLDLDDVWDGSDFLGRKYDGALIELPDLVLHDCDGEDLGTATVQLRLSNLGNHYVRIESTLEDANPADVYAAMFRAAPEHGTADLSFESGTESWPRLSDLAVRLAEDVGASLGADVQVITRPGMFHVVVSVHSASLSPGPATVAERREIRSLAELTGAVGAQVLTNPITHCIGSLAEWIRYSVRRGHGGDGVSLADDRMLRTCNTTLLVALGSPEFSTGTRETVAEFVASLEGLFAGWSNELASHSDRIQGHLPKLAALADSFDVQRLRDQAVSLEEEQIRLQDIAVEARSTAALISSPSLVASPVVAVTVSALLGSAEYQQRVSELNHQIEEVDRRTGSLARKSATRLAQAEQRRDLRRAAWLNTMLAVIAAVGVSGLGQILQAGYDLKQDAAIWITGAIVGLAALVGIVVWLVAGRTGHADRGDDTDT